MVIMTLKVAFTIPRYARGKVVADMPELSLKIEVTASNVARLTDRIIDGFFLSAIQDNCENKLVERTLLIELSELVRCLMKPSVIFNAPVTHVELNDMVKHIKGSVDLERPHSFV